VKKLQIAALVSMMFGLLWIPLYTFQATGVRAEEGETVTGNVYGDDAGEADDWPDDEPMFTLMGGGDDYITFLFEKFNASDKYDPIANPNGPLILHNSASITSEVARLTPAVGSSKGSLFNREYVVLPADRSFSTYFVFKIHGGGGYPPGWGDGFVFTVQKKTNQPSGEGGSLGYADLAPSIAVKFDTWKNDEHDDPSDNHIAILKDGKISPALESHDVSKMAYDFKSGEHHVWIDYNGSNATLEIRLNKNSERPELAELSYPLPDTLANILGTELVYVGFTAATGGAFQNHDILKWYFTNEYNPIDVLTKSYKKAPTGYAITKTETVQHDGSLDLTIKAIGVDNTEGLTIELSADNNAVLSASTLTLDANGEATVNIRSPNGRHLQTTLAILGVAGIRSTHDLTIPGKTPKPDEQDITANAMKNTATVRNVEGGAVVRVYSVPGGVEIGTAANTSDEAADLVIPLSQAINPGDQVRVTVQATGELASSPATVTALEESAKPDAGKIQADGTADRVTVQDVPANTTVVIRDGSGKLLGQKKNGGAAADVVLDELGLVFGMSIVVTLIGDGKLESEPVTVPVMFSQTDAPKETDIDANATTKVVKVTNVPAGATVKVYHANGNPLASGTNNGGAGAAVSLTITSGLEQNQEIHVTLTEPRKTESIKTKATAYYEKSDAPKAADIDPNATTSVVTVKNVPAGATVKVYHADGSPLASGTNNGGAGGEVNLTVNPRLANGQALDVTLTETYKTESDKTRVAAYYEKSEAPKAADIDPNATTSVVTVKNVPAGATVKVYHADGSPLASGTNNGGAGGEVNLTVNPRLANGQALDVTLTETYKTESDKTRVAAYYEQSAALDAADIDPNATTSVVTVKNVPAGATVKVYHADGSPLASGTNNGGAGGEVNLTVNPRLANGQALDVTLTETYKTESDKTRVAAYYEQSAAPKAADIDPNATASVVTVKNVPAGAAVTVYDKNGTPLASNVNNGGAPANVSLTFDPRLANGQELDVTLTETYKTESDKTRVAAYYEQSAALDAARITVNATDLEVTVTGVEPEATITVYGADGSTVLGSHKNNGAANADLVMALAGTLQAGDTVLVTVTEAYRAESAATAAVALAETARLPEERIRADATDSRITITDAPPGAVIVVYDEQGNPIATVKNDSDVAADLTVDIVPELTPGQEIRVTIREPGKLESDPVAIEAQETTPAPDNALDIDIDVEAGTVTVIGVPPHTTVIVYDGNGKEIGREANNGGAPADIVIADLELDESVQISFRERDKHESDKLVIVIKDQAQDAIDEAIAELEIDYQKEDTWESVTLPVYVASVGKHNTAVSWTSSKPDVVEITKPQGGRIEALVHRQQQDVSVILTAKVSKNGVGKTRTFLVIVKAANLTKTVEEGYRKVDVIGGANADVRKDVDVHRVVLTNGTQEAKIDKAVFDHATADRFANDPKSRNSTARIYVNEVPGDEADEFAVEVAGTALERLHGNGNAIEVRTDYGNILIRHETMEDMVDNSLDLYFRLVPVKDAARQQAINSGILNEPAVQNEAAGGKVIDIPGRSMLVETNYSGYPTTLTLYFAKNGIEVPESDADAFLASLRVFVEHSDGTTDLLTPTPVYENGRPVGVSIVIDKFSTFSIIRLLEPIAYIPVRNTPGEPSAGPEPGEQSAGPGPTAPGAAGPDGRTIEIVLDGENYRVDPEGFKVSVGGRTIGIAEVETAGPVVTIRLSEPLPAGYRIKVDYTPASAGGGDATEPRLKPFIGLELAIPGFHAPYIFGFADGTFRPENAITRAEIAAILARNLDLPPGGAYAGLFGDVPAAHWAWSDIERLKRSGLMIGDASGNFRPQAPITRAEMAMIAAKWLGADLSAAGSPAFADVDGGHWAAAAIDAASRAGILVGFEDGTFRPGERLTRAQAVAVMNRLLGRRPHSGIDAPTWPDVRPNHWAFAEIEEASRPHRFLYDDDGRETPVEDDM